MHIDHWNWVLMSIQFKINLFDQQNKDKDDLDDQEPTWKIPDLIQCAIEAHLNLAISF